MILHLTPSKSVLPLAPMLGTVLQVWNTDLSAGVTTSLVLTPRRLWISVALRLALVTLVRLAASQTVCRSTLMVSLPRVQLLPTPRSSATTTSLVATTNPPQSVPFLAPHTLTART